MDSELGRRAVALAGVALLVAAARAQDAPPKAPQDPAPPPAADAPPPRRADDDPVAAALADVDRHLAAGEAPGALELLSAAEKRTPGDARLRLASARAWLAMAEAAHTAGDDGFRVKALVADADARWKQAVALDPTVPGAAVLRARIQRFEENPAGARATLDVHLAAHPGDAAAWALLGDMETTAAAWEAADRAWTKAATLDPANGVARLEATIAKQWLGVPAADLERGYLEAARLLPEEERPIRLLVGLAPRDRERRLALLRKVVAANPRAVRARVWIAWVLRKEGTPDVPAARAALEEAVAVDPKDFAAQSNLAALLDESGASGDALRAYVAAVECGPIGGVGRESEALDRLLHAAPGSRDVPLTLRNRAYAALVAKNPTVGAFANNAGFWFRDVGRDYEASFAWYRKAVAAQPDDQDFLNDTALILLFHLTDRKDGCLPLFEEVLRLVEVEGQEPKRGYWDALENLCKYWFEAGEHRKVIACADKRADKRASIDGRPYPSPAAAVWRARAERALRDAGR